MHLFSYNHNYSITYVNCITMHCNISISLSAVLYHIALAMIDCFISNVSPLVTVYKYICMSVSSVWCIDSKMYEYMPKYMRPYTISRAAEFVGLTVHQLINDNTAVALYYRVFRWQEFNVTPQVHMCLTTHMHIRMYIPVCTMHIYVGTIQFSCKATSAHTLCMSYL